jgi:hypothetical protein
MFLTSISAGARRMTGARQGRDVAMTVSRQRSPRALMHCELRRIEKL